MTKHPTNSPLNIDRNKPILLFNRDNIGEKAMVNLEPSRFALRAQRALEALASQSLAQSAECIQ